MKTFNVFGLEITKKGTIAAIKEEAAAMVQKERKNFKTAVIAGTSATAATTITATVLGFKNRKKRKQLEAVTTNKTTQVVICYVPLKDAPTDWNTSYTKYFTYSEKGEMTPVTGVKKEGATTAPTFATGKYFNKHEENIEVPAE